MGETPVRVLLVEDDDDDYFLTRDLLTEAQDGGYSLERAASYQEGLERMRQNRHDVYLLDYRLGGQTGIELLREAVVQGCQGPVILLTGQGEREVDLEAMKAGAADFLTKGSIDAPQLERSLRYALERWRDKEALRRAHDELEQRVLQRTADLKRANESLREASGRKDELMMMLAHELRNPLAPLRTGLQVMKLSPDDLPALEKARAMIERQVAHLSRIVDDLLDGARLTTGKLVLHCERLDLARLIRLVAEDHRAAFEQAGLSLTVETAELPLWVTGDATRLTQVAGNLLQNSLKFTDPGGRVEVCLRAEPDARQAVLTMRDTGVGIEPELLPQLFDTFTQADRSLDRCKGGLGLGLSVVRGLVELHGGQVRAASDGPGKGTEVTVTLPLEPEPAALSGMPATPPPAGKRLRILVVEDNRDAADMLRLLLEMYGYEVAVAYTGPEGVRAAARVQPDVVLCDIGLPGLDGYGVASALRRDPATARARIIAVTGYGSEEDRLRSREAGFDQHLVKPVDPATLEQLLACGAEAIPSSST